MTTIEEVISDIIDEFLSLDENYPPEEQSTVKSFLMCWMYLLSNNENITHLSEIANTTLDSSCLQNYGKVQVNIVSMVNIKSLKGLHKIVNSIVNIIGLEEKIKNLNLNNPALTIKALQQLKKNIRLQCSFQRLEQLNKNAINQDVYQCLKWITFTAYGTDERKSVEICHPNWSEGGKLLDICILEMSQDAFQHLQILFEEIKQAREENPSEIKDEQEEKCFFLQLSTAMRQRIEILEGLKEITKKLDLFFDNTKKNNEPLLNGAATQNKLEKKKIENKLEKKDGIKTVPFVSLNEMDEEDEIDKNKKFKLPKNKIEQNLVLRTLACIANLKTAIEEKNESKIDNYFNFLNANSELIENVKLGITNETNTASLNTAQKNISYLMKSTFFKGKKEFFTQLKEPLDELRFCIETQLTLLNEGINKDKEEEIIEIGKIRKAKKQNTNGYANLYKLPRMIDESDELNCDNNSFDKIVQILGLKNYQKSIIQITFKKTGKITVTFSKNFFPWTSSSILEEDLITKSIKNYYHSNNVAVPLSIKNDHVALDILNLTLKIHKKAGNSIRILVPAKIPRSESVNENKN